MKKPVVVSVAGPGSNSGKTTFVCATIARQKSLRTVGAMKIATATPDHRCARTGLACSCLQFEGKMRILTEDCIDERTGKDTWKMRESGARPVWFVQATSDVVDQAVAQALDQYDGTDLLVVEGAEPIRSGRADIAVVTGYQDGRPPKEGWEETVRRADFLIGVGDAVSHNTQAWHEDVADMGDLSDQFWKLLEERIAAL